MPKPVPWNVLKAGYAKAKVPDHRLVYDVIYPALKSGVTAPLAALQTDLLSIAELEINLAQVIDELVSAEANTTYEEVVCSGLNSTADTLGAVIHIRRPTGYSGTLCQNGSKEYVAFWADWNNDGTFDEYLGTAEVDVHDIYNIPPEGLYYGVFLPVNLSNRVKPCTEPNIIRIRTVLSWAVNPSTIDPDALNYWGNRIDSLVRVRHVKAPFYWPP
jgi:hypothetical protein